MTLHANPLDVNRFHCNSDKPYILKSHALLSPFTTFLYTTANFSLGPSNTSELGMACTLLRSILSSVGAAIDIGRPSLLFSNQFQVTTSLILCCSGHFRIDGDRMMRSQILLCPLPHPKPHPSCGNDAATAATNVATTAHLFKPLLSQSVMNSWGFSCN